MTTLELYFLGPLEIRSDGRQLPNPPTLKSQSLLAYLVCHRSQPQPRDRLAGLFFGEGRNAKRAAASRPPSGTSAAVFQTNSSS